jgi:AcrR family transcriptional regulator
MTDTAQRLLDAVDAVVAEHGPSGVTLRRVGQQAGLSHTAAAHYYNDKPGLFTAYITRAWSLVADRVEAAATIPDDREALLALATSYATFALEQPSAFSVMSRLELVNVDTPELWAARERGFLTLAVLIDRARANGWATAHETLDLIAITWGLVHGIVDLWTGGPLAAPFDGHELTTTLNRLLDDVLDRLDDAPISTNEITPTSGR